MQSTSAIEIETTACFGVTLDKNRGLLVETFIPQNGDVHFFKHHDQPLDRHCEQVQSIVKLSNVKRSKQIKIDISAFLQEYYRCGEVWFKGYKLNSQSQQVEKTKRMQVNKELGIKKRKATIAENKQMRIDEKNQKFLERVAKQEKCFQEERARRINELTMSRAKAPAVSTEQDTIE